MVGWQHYQSNFQHKHREPQPTQVASYVVVTRLPLSSLKRSRTLANPSPSLWSTQSECYKSIAALIQSIPAHSMCVPYPIIFFKAKLKLIFSDPMMNWSFFSDPRLPLISRYCWKRRCMQQEVAFVPSTWPGRRRRLIRGWGPLVGAAWFARLLSALSLQLPDLSLGFCLMLLLVGGRIKVFPGIYHFDCELEIRMSRKGLQHWC